MNDEIKEILDCIKDTSRDYVGTNGCLYQDLERKELNALLDYITNLQKQIEEYQKALDETMSEKIDLQEENQRLKENNQNMQVEMSRSWERIDKAIEYIEKNKMPLHLSWDEPNCDYWIATNPDDLLNILKGENND